MKLDPTVRTEMDAMLDKVVSYKAEVRKGKEKYNKALATVDASALVDPIVDPLIEGLKAVKGTLDHLTKK